MAFSVLMGIPKRACSGVFIGGKCPSKSSRPPHLHRNCHRACGCQGLNREARQWIVRRKETGVILSYVLLGITAGLRSMTALAVVCWFAWLGLLPQSGWAHWAGSLVVVIVATLAALGEYVGDTLPQAPDRIAPLGLSARIVLGSLAGALAARGVSEPAAGGILFGLIGVGIGAFGGYRVRLYWSRALGRDLPVALLESAIALGLAIWGCWQLHQYLPGVLVFLPQAGQ